MVKPSEPVDLLFSTMDIEHDEKKLRFVASLTDGGGVLDYRMLDGGIMDVYHTHVDPLLRNRGVAGEITAAAFAWARTNSFKVRPSCPYVAAWVAGHPMEHDLIA